LKNVWEASNLEKRNKILRLLIEGGKYFNELCEIAGMGRQTLNIYLKYLVREKCIKRERKGKFVFYSLEINHPYVLLLLERERKLNEIDFSSFDAERASNFLIRWLNLLEDIFLVVVHDYIEIGEWGVPEVKKYAGEYLQLLEQDIVENISFMNEACRLYGELLSKKIQIGDVNPEMILAAKTQLLERLKKDRISES